LAVLGLYFMERIPTKTLSLLIFSVVFVVGFKLIYESTYRRYLYRNYANYRQAGENIAKSILRHKPQYIMTDGKKLQLFFYI
jgi:hypothetical protein